MNSWYVIAGGVCSGKTATVTALADAGHTVMPEIAREVIHEELAKGKSIEQILRDEVFEFQMEVFRRKLAREAGLPRDTVIFFDRAVPDTRAYLKYRGIGEPEEVTNTLATISYRHVFLLDSLPMEEDYARTENATERAEIHAALGDAYESLGLPVTRVPVLPLPERVAFILDRVD